MQTFATKPLPAAPRLFAMLGPGLVWMALAQGSGELIWWPYIVAKYGLAFLFLLIPACLLQFPLTFEIGRYTLLTGEGVFRGFFRLHKAFGIFLWAMFTLSFLWFGAFASAGGTAIAALTNFPRGWTPRGQTLFWAQASIFVFTFALLYAKTVYRLIEWVMKIVAIVSLVGMGVACFHPSVWGQVGAFLKGLVVPDMTAMKTWDWNPKDTDRLLTAFAFAGLGGFWTLFYSYWMKEKGAGMAKYGEHITGFRSGAAAIHVGHATLPADEPEAPRQLRRWYRYLATETWIGVLGNLATTLMTCLLAFALLRPEGLYPDGFDLAVVQAKFFVPVWGTFGRLLFLFIAGAFLADTWLATVDCVARIHLDAITTLWPRVGWGDLRPWYYGLVLALAVVTSVTMYFQQPGTLIILSAVIGFIGTVIYSAALVVLNHFTVRGKLASPLRPGLASRWTLIAVTLIYAALAAAYIYARWGRSA